MVGYEVSLVLRAMPKADLMTALKRVCTNVMKDGTIIKQLENLGESRLPYAISAHKERFRTGRYSHWNIR